MVKYTGAVCRLCRRENIKLFLKGTKCSTDKCPFNKRDYPPGQRAARRRAKTSNYALQLREKQKVKRVYGLGERQFRVYFRKAERIKGVTGEILLQLLERRLDNVVFHLRFASSHAHARQLLKHGFFMINGRKVDIPSYLVKSGDEISVYKKTEKNIKQFKELIKRLEERETPAWLKLDAANLKAKVLHLPQRSDVQLPVQEQLIVELYSKV
jgi:small subunit ribosomal protein S4